jgi:hypothetical protein
MFGWVAMFTYQLSRRIGAIVRDGSSDHVSNVHRHIGSDIDLQHAAGANGHRQHRPADLLSSAVMLLLTLVLIVAWALSVG